MIDLSVDAVELRSPLTITPDTPATEAAQHLRNPDVPALVVREADAIVGIVTESDIVALVAETVERPSVGAIMSTPVSTIALTATLHDAAETMRTAGVKHLPVVSDGRYRGLLSAETLAPYLSRHHLEIEWQDESMRVDAGESRELSVSD